MLWPSVFPDDVSWVNQFGDSAWMGSRLIYVLWRLFLAAIMMAGFALNLSDDVIGDVAAWYPIYLTNWALFFENLYLNLSFTIALWIYRTLPDPDSNQPSVTKMAWVLRSIGQPGALVVTVAFWALVYNGRLTLTTFWVHGINSIVVWVDILTSCYEVRLLHYVYVLAFGISYVVWSVIHYHANIQDGRTPSHRFIYSAVDWSPSGQGKVRYLQATQMPFHQNTHTCLLCAQQTQPHRDPCGGGGAQAAIVSVVVLVVLTPICVAILAGLAAVRDALSGPARQSKIAGPAGTDGDRGGGVIAAMVWPGPAYELGPV